MQELTACLQELQVEPRLVVDHGEPREHTDSGPKISHPEPLLLVNLVLGLKKVIFEILDPSL